MQYFRAQVGALSALLILVAFGCRESGGGSTDPPASAQPSATPQVSPTPTPLQGILLTAASSIDFAATPVTGGDLWACAGMMDLAADGRLAVVAVGEREVRILRVAHPAGDPDWPAEQRLPISPELQGQYEACGTGDIDGNGLPDLALFTVERGELLLNQDGRRFERRRLPDLPTDESPAMISAVALIDLDDDGDLDIYLARSRVGGSSAFLADGCKTRPDGETLCGLDDRRYIGTRNLTFRNDGDAGFVLHESGGEDRRLTLAAGVADLDHDGQLDVLSVNDGGRNALFMMSAPGQLEDHAEDMGLAQRNHGMGVDFGDLDGDGQMDLAIADIGRPAVFLGDGHHYRAVGAELGFGPIGQWAWGTEIEDFDNDGDLDLLFENELLSAAYWEAECTGCGLAELPAAELLLYRNELTERGVAGFAAEAVGQFDDAALPEGRSEGGGSSLAAGDIDGDGLLDVVLVRSRLEGDEIVWLGRGVATAAGRAVTVDAPVGAQARLCAGARCWERQVVGNHSYRALHPARVHFGVGMHERFELELEWPPGELHRTSVAAGQRVVLPPSAAFCRGDVVVSPPAALQVCDGQSCVPAESLENCGARGLACDQGACVLRCEVDGCSAPPAPHCDGDRRMHYPNGGLCGDVGCDYAAAVVAQDCQNDGRECVDGACVPLRIGAGDLVLNEVLFDMHGDRSGKGFLELRNTTSRTLSLQGLTFYNGQHDGVMIEAPYEVPAGELFTIHLLAQSDDPAPWADDPLHMTLPAQALLLPLDNNSVELVYKGLRVHRMAYGVGRDADCSYRFPMRRRTAAQRDPQFAAQGQVEAVNTEWCVASEVIDRSDPRFARYIEGKGTPGAPNPPCAEPYRPCDGP